LPSTIRTYHSLLTLRPRQAGRLLPAVERLKAPHSKCVHSRVDGVSPVPYRPTRSQFSDKTSLLTSLRVKDGTGNAALPIEIRFPTHNRLVHRPAPKVARTGRQIERRPRASGARRWVNPQYRLNTVYVIAVMTSLNCGVDVVRLRALGPDSTGEHAQTYSTLESCIAARDRLIVQAQRDATRQLDLRCPPEDSALPRSNNGFTQSRDVVSWPAIISYRSSFSSSGRPKVGLSLIILNLISARRSKTKRLSWRRRVTFAS